MGRYERTPLCTDMVDAEYHDLMATRAGVDICVDCGWRSDGLVDTGEDVADRRKPTSSVSKQREVLEAVVDAETAAWRNDADSAIREAASNLPLLSSDDVWEILELRRVPPPREPRALGPAMKHAIKLGIISSERSDFVVSRRPENHGRPVRIYTSHLYVEPVETVDIQMFEGSVT